MTALPPDAVLRRVTETLPAVDVLLVSTPRHFWPFVAADDNFVVPQALVYLAAHLRQNGVRVQILDCMPLKMGWRTLAQKVRELRPKVVALGENHALYAHEAFKCFRMVKEIDPTIWTVAGGAHMSHMAHEGLLDPCLDVVVHGEGELTFTELCQSILGTSAADTTGRPDLSNIQGISYREVDDNGEGPPKAKVHNTRSRALIRDLDELPLPAYDLLPMELYGTSKYLFSPGGATIQHSRGCTLSCSFCAWWTMMAKRTDNEDGSVTLQPRWRTFGVERHLEEVELLAKRYNKKCMMYVDESWNINPDFNLRYSEEILRRKLDVKWFGFMRADAMLRDHKTGILGKMVEAGMAHICIGVERAEDTDLSNWNKHRYSTSQTREVFRILKDDYPSVFRQGTFIVGIKDESKESIWQVAQLAKDLDLDYPAFHPVTPVPGTAVYEEAKRDAHFEVQDFKSFDWMTPVMRSRYMTRDEIAWEIYEMNKSLISAKWLARGLTDKTAYRRYMYTWFTKIAAKQAVDLLSQRVNPLKSRDYMNLVKPTWYDG